MDQQSESALDRLTHKFHEKNVIRHRGRPPTINPMKFIEARSSGMTLASSMRAAGSEMTDNRHLTSAAIHYLDEHPDVKVTLLDTIEQKKRKILDSMTDEKIEKASLSSQAVTFGILTDKGELLAGRPTARMDGGDAELEKIKTDKLALVSYVLGYLNASRKKD